MAEVVPAILTNDLADLEKKLKSAESFGARRVQIDITDNRFVKGDKTIGTVELAQLRSRLELEVHLMVNNPILYIEAAKYAQAQLVIVHKEPLKNPEYFAKLIHRKGMEAGLALNPETDIHEIKPWFDYFDLVLFLGVTPGAQGRGFQQFVGEKIEEFRRQYPDAKIAIDGGVTLSNIRDLHYLRLNEIVVGSGIWKDKEPGQMYKRLQQLAL